MKLSVSIMTSQRLIISERKSAQISLESAFDFPSKLQIHWDPICPYAFTLYQSFLLCFAMQTAVLVTQRKTVAKDASSGVICMDTSPGSAPCYWGAILVCFLSFVTVVMLIRPPSLPFRSKPTRVQDPEGQGSSGDSFVHIRNP